MIRSTTSQTSKTRRTKPDQTDSQVSELKAKKSGVLRDFKRFQLPMLVQNLAEVLINSGKMRGFG